MTSVETAEAIYDIPLKDIDGQPISLEAYRGKVLLMVNVASKCGFTRQYAGLEALYQKYKDQGFTVLSFPCNQFGRHEHGTNEEIKQFCSTKYQVSFPLCDKIEAFLSAKTARCVPRGHLRIQSSEQEPLSQSFGC
jgi:glutathione peroxidase